MSKPDTRDDLASCLRTADGRFKINRLRKVKGLFLANIESSGLVSDLKYEFFLCMIHMHICLEFTSLDSCSRSTS